MSLTVSLPVVSYEAVEVVAIGSESSEGLFIKQAFDAAAQADLIGVILEAHRPTHLPVPAAAENHHPSRS